MRTLRALCRPSCFYEVSCVDVSAMVYVSILRIAGEVKLRGL